MQTREVNRLLERYQWASGYLEGLIQGPPTPPPDATRDEIRARQLARVERLRRFLEFIGNPHLAYRTVHVGGTSGKGSTSAFLASILTRAGYRTGLHVSPYLQVETEKLQIGDRLMSADALAGHIEDLDREVSRWMSLGNHPLTYGEFWVALTFFSFAHEGCEFVVTEVGAGGRFDLTNLIEPEISVITSVGLDHVRTLGETIPEIAWHKAGIIKPGTPAVTTVDDEDALPVIRKEAQEQGAELIELRRGRDYHYEWQHGAGVLTMEGVRARMRLPLPGAFQASNAAASIRAVQVLGQSSATEINEDAIQRGIESTRFPGRVEIPMDRPQVVLDGAHNPEKMRALIDALNLFPVPEHRIMILGSLGGHDFLEVARIAAPEASEVIVTAPSAVERPSAPVNEIAEVVRNVGRPVDVILDPLEALRAALDRAGTDDQIVVTGSLYLVGAVREHWYPSQEILVQQTPWPEMERE